MKTVSVCAISDLHGQIPPDIAPVDLLLIAGDIGLDNRSRLRWFNGPFREWIDRQPAKEIVATWGNHDRLAEHFPDLIPKLRWHVLADQTIELFGLKIFGSPYTPPFGQWSFMLEEHQLERKWSQIPDDTDIIMTHGPPHGHGDLAPTHNGIRKVPEHVGSPSLMKRIEEIRPEIVLAGHIHPGHGVYFANKWATTIYNCSLLNDEYEMVNRPHYFLAHPREEVKID